MFRINILLLLSIMTITITSLFADPPEPPAGKHWEKVSALSDEFDSWDSNKWAHSLWNYDVPNIMMQSQAFISDGKLCIRAQLHNDPQRWMKTCRITSKTKIRYPVYLECSMKASDISCYNTFWLNDGDINNREEIDVCENNANPTNPNCQHGAEMPYTMQSNIHHCVNGDNIRSPWYFSTKDLSASNPKKGEKFSEGYHTIACHWADNRNVYWYLNDEYTGVSKAGRDFVKNGLFVLFDQWTNTWDGLADKNSLNDNSRNTMYVDWVRTWRLVDGTPIVNKVNPLGAFIGMSGKVEIYDIRGRVIQTISSDNITEVNQLLRTRTKGLSTGLYLYWYIIGNKTIVNKKIRLFQ